MLLLSEASPLQQTLEVHSFAVTVSRDRSGDTARRSSDSLSESVESAARSLAVRIRGGENWPCAIVLLSFPLVYHITTPAVYRHPIDPVIVIQAVYAGMRLRIAKRAQEVGSKG
jgi:hypothetical protein